MPLIKTSELAYNLSMNAIEQLIKQQRMFLVSNFQYKDLKFVFRVPYKLDYAFDGEYFIHENNELDIFVRETSFDKFLASFHEFMFVLWAEYAEERDENLHIDAIELKRLLINMLEVTR